MKYLLLASIVACVAGAYASTCTCGLQAIQSRIVNGKDAAKGTKPYMAALYKVSQLEEDDPYWTNRPYCGGVLINDRYVITAAHCLAGGKTPKDIAILFDYYDLKDLKKTKVYKAAEFIVHKNYDDHPKNPKGDIALIRLAETVQLSSKVSPICLPSKSQLEFGLMTAVGWGRVGRNDLQAATLQEADLDHDDSCTLYYGDDFINDHVCVKDKHQTKKHWKDICNGDSGGPLVGTEGGVNTLAGLVSWGTCLGIPASVFTRVSHYLDWVMDNTKDATYCEKPNFYY